GQGQAREPGGGAGNLEAARDSARGLAGEGEMRTLYLPYEREFDEETSSWTVTGRDSEGQDFGVAAGESLELAQERLKDWVLDSLLASAGDGEDRFGDLLPEDPGGAIAFTGVDLVPIRLRLVRS